MDKALEGIFSHDWHERRHAIEILLSAESTELVPRLLGVIREHYRDINALNAALQVLAESKFDIIPEILSLAADPSPEVRTHVMQLLGEIQDTRAVPILIKALDDPDPNVQFNAIVALGQMRVLEAVQPLAQLACSGNYYLAFPAIEALIQIGTPLILPPMLNLLSNPELAPMAIHAMGEIGNTIAIPPILEWLKGPHGDIFVALPALITLVESCEEKYGHSRAVRDYIVSHLGNTFEEKIVSFIQDMAEGKVPQRTTQAYRAPIIIAGWWLESSVIPETARSVRDTLLRAFTLLIENPTLRPWVLDALQKGGKAALPVLLSALKHPDPNTRVQTLEALYSTVDFSATDDLIVLLDEEDEKLVSLAAATLAKIGDLRAYPFLLKLMGHPSAQVRQNVIAALNSLGHPQHTQMVLPFLEDPNPLVRESAVRTLGYFGDPVALETLLAVYNREEPLIQRAIVEVLPFFEDERALAVLREALQSKNVGLRLSSIKALAYTSLEFALPILLDAFSDADYRIRASACRTAAVFGDKRLLPSFLSLARDPHPAVRAEAVEALNRFPDESILDTLASCLEDPEPDVTLRAIRLLRKIHHPDATLLLHRAANSTNPEIQHEAILALGDHSSDVSIETLAALAQKPDLKRTCFEALARIHEPRAAMVLMSFLENHETRDLAIQALASMGDIAISVIERGLYSPIQSLGVRLSLVEVLHRMHSPQAIECLIRLLQHPHPETRLASILALGDLGNDRAISILQIIGHSDPNPSIRAIITQILRAHI